MEFTVKPLGEGTPIPDINLISSVFLIAIKDSMLVVTKDKRRGWDLPGGHVEKGETALQALRREAMEEAGMTFEDATPFVVVENNASEGGYLGKVMVGYMTKHYALVGFSPAEDVSERSIMDIEDFIDRYEGDKKHIRAILDFLPA